MTTTTLHTSKHIHIETRPVTKRHRTVGAKVKSGCITCKARKLKCGEEKPSCRRCLSTGRVCEGYGIWGGGGNSYNERYGHWQSHARSVHLDALIGFHNSIPVVRQEVISASEKHSFQWFWARTVPKLSGLFYSPFWSVLLFQVSSSEPSVLHAVLALSSAHRKDSLNVVFPGVRWQKEEEYFTVNQYNKAIQRLQQHITDTSTTSARVTLVACAALIYLEYLRENYKTANLHLNHGLSVLNEVRSPCPQSCCIGTDKSLSMVDKWLTETFLSLYLQAELCGQTGLRPWPSVLAIVPERMPNIFESANTARRSLENLMIQILQLTQRRRDHLDLSLLDSNSMHVAYLQIQKDLKYWLEAHEATLVAKSLKTNILELIAHKILRIFHKMAEIMAYACYAQPAADESIYDHQIHNFASIVDQSIDLYKMIFPAGAEQVHAIHGGTGYSSTSDIGWIPPLYFTAIKCRQHHIRLHAIRLLRSTPHKEGIWNSELAAAIATEVMKIEEEGFHDDLSNDEDFPLFDGAKVQTFEAPTLPESRRLRDVELILPDSSGGEATLRYKRKVGTKMETVVSAMTVSPM